MKKILLTLVAAATMCVPVSAQNSVKNVYTSQNSLDCAKVLNIEQPVLVNRYLMAGYNTLCLPMSVGAEQMQTALAGVRLERLVAIAQEGTTLNLYFMDCTAEGIEAGMPYLIFSPKTTNLRLRNTEAKRLSDNLQTVRLSDESGNIVSFGSSWETVCQDGLYGIPAMQDKEVLESILIRTTADKAFLPTRCGVNWEKQANGATDIVICHIQSLDDVTAIRSINQTTEKATYDLNGRKTSSAQKGIVIQNGKKVVIK